MEKKRIRNLKIPWGLKESFYKEIASENLQRIIIISIAYLILEVTFALFDMNTAYTVSEDIRSYFIISFHIVSITMAILIRYRFKNTKGIVVQVLVYIYCIILVYWSITTSLNFIEDHGSITFYILTLTVISAFFYRRALITILTNLSLLIYFHYELYMYWEIAMSDNIITLEASRYMADTVLMTAICSVLTMIVYRLRLTVFLEKKDLKDLAIKDSMTKLLNHKAICDCLEKVVLESRQNNEKVSIIMTDIDHFKKINDSYGHQVGDQVIIKIANILLEMRQGICHVGRYGGEEFLIILEGIGIKEARIFAEKFRHSVEKEDFGIPQRVTVSGGVKALVEESSKEMIKCADALLYQAKEKGRNCIMHN